MDRYYVVLLESGEGSPDVCMDPDTEVSIDKPRSQNVPVFTVPEAAETMMRRLQKLWPHCTYVVRELVPVVPGAMNEPKKKAVLSNMSFDGRFRFHPDIWNEMVRTGAHERLVFDLATSRIPPESEVGSKIILLLAAFSALAGELTTDQEVTLFGDAALTQLARAVVRKIEVLWFG